MSELDITFDFPDILPSCTEFLSLISMPSSISAGASPQLLSYAFDGDLSYFDYGVIGSSTSGVFMSQEASFV
jgi:hypothetical protein